MKKILCIMLCLMMLLLSACAAPAQPTPDPIPDPPVQTDPTPEQTPPVEALPEETPEEIPEENPEETPPEQTETPIETDYSAIQAEVEAFLSLPGVNGFICGGGNWPEEPVRLNEVVYQLSDEAFPYDEVVAAYAANVGEVHTDLSYCSSAKLDELLQALTGYGLYENGEIASCWNLEGLTYLEDLGVYCIQHGDTNYQPMRAQVMSYEEETHQAYVRLTCRIEDMGLFCYIAGSFTPCRYFDLVLRHTGENQFEIQFIQPEVK